MESIFDKLDELDENDEAEALLDAIQDAKDEISGVDDEVKDLSTDLGKFKEEWYEQPFYEVKSFIDECLSGYIERLDAIAKKLY
jgi:predicted nuclease with TOPRIM domain